MCEESQELTASDEFRMWVFDNIPSVDEKIGLTASQACEKFDKLSIQRVSNVLVELLKVGVLSRRKNPENKWEYFLKEYHDPEDYITEFHAQILLEKKMGSYAATVVKLQNRIKRLEDDSRRHQLHVECDCGRTIAIQLTGEVIKDG